MASHTKNVELAKTIPTRLLRFFARFPPPLLLSSAPPTLNTSSSDPNADLSKGPDQITSSSPTYENPFRNTQHPITGCWHDPVYSLRRQADLVKLAAANGVQELLPFTTKGTEERLRKREELGLRVKGTGVGQKVKGKWWERNIRGRLEKRRQAMLDMPQMIQTWKQVSCSQTTFGTLFDRLCSSVMGGVGRSSPNENGALKGGDGWLYEAWRMCIVSNVSI